MVWSNDYDGGGKAGCVSATGDAIVGVADHEVGVVFIASEEIQRYAEEHDSAVGASAPAGEETRAELRSHQMLTGDGRGTTAGVPRHRPAAQRVLELGTYSGYSAVSMAGVLPPGGHRLCEVDETQKRRSPVGLEEAGTADRVTIYLGPALETIERLEGEFDLIFIDADKVNYPAYYESLVPRLSAHGLMVLDNTLLVGAGRGGPTTLPRRRRSPRSTTASPRIPTWSRSCSPFVTA